MQENQVSFENETGAARLGKAPAKSDTRLLQAARFMETEKEPPAATNFWPGRVPFKPRHFGNVWFGNCTRAKQAIAALRMERLEQRRTTKISDEEPIRVYKEMTTRLYGADWENNPEGSDLGAYELDALSEWRKPEFTFRDYKGRPLTIDAFVGVNHRSIWAVKNALATAGAKGISVCFNLPFAFQFNLQKWDIPEGRTATGMYLPGTWGGHSMWAYDYDEQGLFLDHTWNIPGGFITWKAFAAYCDESYLVIDSWNQWKKANKKAMDFDALKKAVNEVSSYPIK